MFMTDLYVMRCYGDFLIWLQLKAEVLELCTIYFFYTFALLLLLMDFFVLVLIIDVLKIVSFVAYMYSFF
jgi:hypothetical protein